MAIAFVNVASNGANNVTSITVTITTTAGNDVLVCITASSSAQIVTSVTDTGGSAYAQRGFIANGANATFIWSARNVAASTSVTVKVSAAQRLVVVVAQYSGVASLGRTATNTGSSVAPTVSLTTQDNNNFIVAALGDVGGTEVITANTGNLRASKGTGTAATGVSVAGVDNTSATPASVTCSDTLSISNAWAAVALELRTVAPIWEAVADDHSLWREPSVLPLFTLLADETAFLPPPPPLVAVSGEDDFTALSSLYTAFHEDDMSGFIPAPPPIQPSAEDDFVFYMPGWPIYDDDLSGFSPLPPLAQPSAEDDFIFALPPWSLHDIDISGFAPAAVLLAPSGDDELSMQQMFYFSGSLAALVPTDALGFLIPAVVAKRRFARIRGFGTIQSVNKPNENEMEAGRL